MNLKHKQLLRQKRIWRIRKKVSGTAECPRLCVTFTNRHIYAQAIDDEAGRTLVAAASTEKAARGQSLRANVNGAAELGKQIGEKAKAAGIESIVFDRHGRRYHGRVREFADAVRAAGIKF